MEVDDAYFTLLKMTKLHAAMSQVINIHKVQAQRGDWKAIQPGGPDYEANWKSAVQRQTVSTSFLDVNMKWKLKTWK